ncbi:hypothetical protein [Ornithobacterium rhinotracheale]|uniref:hypothetical protein n=1 Tax=Ornithobacterium rhinotracheale TaxID=28251 RepID=UPI001FF41300|nr:hypothetical protein [Ornithobacterium rhinotracheale]MCK0202317.1 hypothetical protein [Ornithobacterium rhinotracheale]
MPTHNLISVEFSTEDLKKIDDALAAIEEALKGKTRNLTPEERRQLGCIAEQNKLFVNKTKTYMEQHPDFIPKFLNKAEFDKDFVAREMIETRILRLQSIVEQLADTKTLLDNDNYNNSLTFYRNIKFLSGEDVPGTTNISKDLQQFFPRSKRKTNNDSNETPKED